MQPNTGRLLCLCYRGEEWGLIHQRPPSKEATSYITNATTSNVLLSRTVRQALLRTSHSHLSTETGIISITDEEAWGVLGGYRLKDRGGPGNLSIESKAPRSAHWVEGSAGFWSQNPLLPWLPLWLLLFSAEHPPTKCIERKITMIRTQLIPYASPQIWIHA